MTPLDPAAQGGAGERFLSLAYLTVAGVAPPVQVEVAAEAGFQGVGLRVSGGRPGDSISTIGRDRGMLRETERRLRATGMRVLDVEVVRITPEWRLADEAPTFEWAARLGAANVLVLSFDRDEARTVDAFVAVCRRAGEYGLQVVLEFAVFSGVRTLGQAVGVLERAAQPNAGLLVDALHLFRSGGAVGDVRAVATSHLRYVQLCDARAQGPSDDEARRHEALFDRLLPGEGDLALVEFLGALPAAVPISVEAPCLALADEAPLVRARRAAVATRSTLAERHG